MIISYSEMYKWDTCERQWYYRFGLGLKPNEEAGAMVTGTKGHKLLQTFYTGLKEGYSKEKAYQHTKKAAQAMISTESITEVTSLLQSWTLVDNYIRDNEFNITTALIENRFLFPASMFTDDPELADVQIGFTPDVVFERAGGFYDVEDFKFVQRKWHENKINRFVQLKLYQIFLKMMGYNVSRSTLRFFNVKTGIITHKDYITGPTEEETIIRDFLKGVKQVVRHRQLSLEEMAKSRRTTVYTACDFCAFAFPCNLEAQGKDATATLKVMFRKNDYDYST